MAEYINREYLLDAMQAERERLRPLYDNYALGFEKGILLVKGFPYADVATVVHGRWEIRGGDLHSSGYAIYCSVCGKTHFVHYKYSLGGMYGCKELFEKPKHCPSCGAFMEFEE